MTSSSLPSRFSSPWVWPLALLLAAQVSLYIFLAPRGFEFTDEAFYLLNAMHWREFTAVYSMFGAFLQLPMQLSGGSLVAMRLLSLLTLAAGGAWLGHEVQRHMAAGRSVPRIARQFYWLAGAAGGLYFFGVLSTMRVSSYNTLALSAAAVATGFFLRGIDAGSGRSRLACAAAYGFVMGICGLSKGSTGFLVGCLHLAYFAWANPRWHWRGLAQLLAGVGLGLGLQLVLVTLAHPNWIQTLQAGASLFSYDTGGKLGGMFNSFRWDIQRVLRWAPLALAGLAAWTFLVRLLWKKQKQAVAAWLAMLLLAGMVFAWLQKDQVRYWWPAALLLVSALYLMHRTVRQPAAAKGGERRELGLTILMFSLPFAFSFGTNMPVLWHSQAAAMFVVLILLVRLETMWQEGSINASMIGLAVCLLCFPPFVFQIRAAYDSASVYRLAGSLLSQSEPHMTPVGIVKVDIDTKRTFDNLKAAAQQAGLVPGQAILDFTGDGPGLVLALSGHPVGVPWLVGGYDNSTSWAGRLVESLPAATIRGAWLLTSPDNPRAIREWPAIISKKLGADSHELAAVLRVRAPSKWTKEAPSEATLCLWRPRQVAAAEGSFPVLAQPVGGC